MRRLLPSLGVSIVIALATKLWSWQHNMDEQLSNMVIGQAYAECLLLYEKQNSKYPASLEDIHECWGKQRDRNAPFGRDWWGHPFKYETRGRTFILVSFGRDDKPDSADPWGYRDLNEQDYQKRLICNQPDSDQVISDLGIHRACLK